MKLINKKGAMIMVDIVATIGIIVFIVLYFIFMALIGLQGKVDERIGTLEVENNENINLYAFLETPVGDVKMSDLLIEYADSGFNDDSLLATIKLEAEKIFRELYFCTDEGGFHINLLVLDDGFETILLYSDLEEDYVSIYDPRVLSAYTYTQQLPFKDGLFYVRYNREITDELDTSLLRLDRIHQGCEVLSYE